MRSLRDKWYIFTEARQELAEHFGSKPPALGLQPPVEPSRTFNKASNSNEATVTDEMDVLA